MGALISQTRVGALTRSGVLTLSLAVAAPTWLDGQQTKAPARTPDVHFVPTDTAVVRAMLRVTKVGPEDLVYDLGCGDGRIVITAAKRYGARGVCVDIDPARIAESRRNAAKAGVTKRIRFREADLFETDLREATVVTLYLLPSLNERLRPKLFRELRPGTRVASNAFDMGEWKADSVLEVKTGSGVATFAYYWIIPADVAGEWKVSLGGDREYSLRLEQRYQRLTATAAAGGRVVPVIRARMDGDRVSFALSDTVGGETRELRFRGRVKGDQITGTVEGAGRGRPRSWSAQRIERGPRPELEAGGTSASP